MQSWRRVTSTLHPTRPTHAPDFFSFSCHADRPSGGFINFKLRVVRVVRSCASFQLLSASRPGNTSSPTCTGDGLK
ncbi:hypothetical protein Pmani_033997 [Petrolisthes manimaculis]|uniref:Uncharacterized protein n=1 Tax=Petrolisthes manimaculis TaxID=1843537 RepID=A0AAE1NPS9_9EUCA|nr:hypothetical protein Pmani_033997 [Petrolisthes manimaculis]